MEKLNFLTDSKIKNITQEFGSPLYIYDEATLKQSAFQALNFPNAFGLCVRYSMKSSSNANILKIFDQLGLEIDASSGYEAERALTIGIKPQKIQITAQELPDNLEELINKKILFVACSLHQIESYGKLFPGSSLGIRINPGLGSGHSRQTNVGGPSSSFGIWWELIPHVKQIIQKYSLKINKLHTHIGSGSDPKVWEKVAVMSLNTLKEFPEVTTLNLGGGFKVGRMSDEKSTNMQECGIFVKKAFENFYKESNRKVKLEIEPGTFLSALSGSIITKVMDKVSTGENGFTFLKINSGMTEIMRPSLYNARHPLVIIHNDDNSTSNEVEKVIIVGHCCESGDILTPIDPNNENIIPIELPKAEIGDFLIIEGTGSYCSSMTCANYNSFPRSAEVLHKIDGSFQLMRSRETIEHIIKNEIF